jgi:hypothetical protein
MDRLNELKKGVAAPEEVVIDIESDKGSKLKLSSPGHLI